MVLIEDIEVRIASSASGEALIEYDDPKAAPSGNGFSATKFIEAVTGLEYQVEVYIKPSFELWDADGLDIGVNIDGGVVNQFKFHRISGVEACKKNGKPITVDSTVYQEGSKWYETPFSFGALNIGKSF